MTAQHYMQAPAVEGDGAGLPVLLVVKSMQANDGVVETGLAHKRPAFPGRGGYEITWSPGTIHFDLESAHSGHLCLVVDDFANLRKATGGLPAKELTLLAREGAGSPHQDQDDGRVFGKLKIQLRNSNATPPK